MEANETLLTSAPAELVGALREIDFQTAQLAARAQALLQSHAAVQGWSLDTHNVNIDIATAMFTVTPKETV